LGTSLTLDTGSLADFQSDVYLAQNFLSSIPVSFSKASMPSAPSQSFDAVGTGSFNASTDLTTTSCLVDLKASNLNFTNAASNLKVGVGGVNLTGNSDFTAGTLTGATSGAQKITFATAGSPTTVTWASSTTVNLPAWSALQNQIEFTGAQNTTWITSGKTMNDLSFAKSGTAVAVSLSGQVLTTEGSVTLTSGTLNLVDTRLVFTGDGRGLTLASSSTLNLSTTSANGGVAKGLFFNAPNTTQTLANNGTVNLTSTNHAASAQVTSTDSPMHLAASTVQARWTGNDLTWTGGDLALSRIHYQYGATPAKVLYQQSTASFLFFDDSNVHLQSLRIAGAVNFDGFPGSTANSNSLTLSGNFDFSATTARLNNLAGSSTKSTVTFDNSAAVTLATNGVGAGKNFYHLTLAGTGGALGVTLTGNLGVVGNLRQASTTSFDITGQAVLASGDVEFVPTSPASFTSSNSSIYLVPTAAVQLTTSASAVFHNLVVLANGGAVTQASALAADNLAAFAGVWTTGAHSLALTGDFVSFGAGYKPYTISGVTFFPVDDGEKNATRTVTGLLNYPYFGSTLPAVATMGTLLDTFTGSAHLLHTSARTDAPDPALTTASFQLAAGAAWSVGGSFYNHGSVMNAPGALALTLPVHWTSKSLTASPATDWFGRPFAVAIATGSGMTITNINASHPIGAAQTSVAAVNVVTSTNWDTTRPTITSAATRFDNLVEVTFSEVLQNEHGEAQASVNSSLPADNLRFSKTNSPAWTGIDASTLWDFTAGTPGSAGEYATVATTSVNKPILSFQTSGTGLGKTWNTDATGSSGLGANNGIGGTTSTDRNGTYATLIPDLTLEKGRLYDTSGNPVINYDASNYNGAALSTRFTATTDLARPVLTTVVVSQAAKAFPPATPQDGHNGFTLTWSEPVSLDPEVLNKTIAAGAFNNLLARNSFGDSFTTDGSSVKVTGLFDYPGKLYRSTRTWGAANGGADPSNAQNDASNQKTSNSLFRTTAYDLSVYVAGHSTGTGTSEYWDGFWYDADDPNAKVYSVPPAYATKVLDSAGNAVEDTNVVWAHPAVGTDPKNTRAISQTGQGWELEAPTFAPYTLDTYEVIPKANLDPDKIDEVQFHVLANTNHSGQNWKNDPVHPDKTDTSHFGMRDSSLTNFHAGLRLGVTTENTFDGTHNLPFDSVAPYLDNTGVSNDLFNGGPPPVPGFAVSDDGYFTLKLQGVSDLWKPTVNYHFTYNRYEGMATNLAGGLLASTPTTGLLAIDRTLPYITLTLTGRNMDRIYVQFSREVKVVDPLGSAKFENVLSLAGSTNSKNKITRMEFLDGTSKKFQQAFLYLYKPFDPSDFVTSRLSAGVLPGTSNQVSTVVAGTNNMDTTVTYPVSFLGIDLAEPIWATDGQGSQANISGTAHVVDSTKSVHAFDGTEPLTARDIELQAKVWGGDTTPLMNQLPLRLYFDLNVPSSLVVNKIWLPSGLYSTLRDQAPLVPAGGNGETRYLDPYVQSTDGSLKNFVIPGNDPELVNGSTLEFLFSLGSLYVVHGTDTSDPRQLTVWKVPLKAIKTQKNGMTILNNVIDPTKGQQTQVLYTMKKSGVISVQVFALDGSLVRVLQRGRQAPGEYSIYWDGKNASGEVVARGVYFIRAIAPEIDETRNVLVIK